MNKDVTYCANEKCPHKYKCELYRDKTEGQDFWYTEYNPESCGGMNE